MRTRTVLLITGIASVLLYLALWRLSLAFNWGEGYAERPILAYLALYAALFGLYAWAALKILKSRYDWNTLWLILILGLLFRGAILPADQIQEDDIYRYLWDGKVFAHGVNPYKYSPNEVSRLKEFMIRDPASFEATYSPDQIRELTRLYQLKWQSDKSLVYMERINHPGVPTIYPPMAQYVFRLVHTLKPDSIAMMRLAFFVFDLMAVAFIALTLRALGMNPNWCLVYYWCPLVIKETFNSTHLDIIGIAFLTGAIYFLVRARYYVAYFFLALSVLGKLYPAILLPLYLKRQLQSLTERGTSPWKACAAGAALFVGVVAVGYLPFVNIGRDAFEGLETFTTYWQNNDSLFALVLWFYGSLLGLSSELPVGFSYDLPSLLAKITVLVIVLAVLAYLFFRKARIGGDADRACLSDQLIIMGLVFLLSPVQNPWYLMWVVPYLCFFPWRSWLLLTGLVGLYYLDFYFEYQDMKHLIPWVVWIEFTPFYLAFAYEWWRRKQNVLTTDAHG
ncbi:DUF2029 domain-containing protein [Nitrospina gracilis]|uniref:DUF2029 domain-containing protein n=1 Tax=Nitrospina gracilis TaxID=35801 RepID=UPI001F1D8524|nr:DUF2029 domain-containing protein [Nitrospina gracilis]MCF8721973.1 hypothetical protein [Nitrospina gracilis Nb-211]